VLHHIEKGAQPLLSGEIKGSQIVRVGHRNRVAWLKEGEELPRQGAMKKTTNEQTGTRSQAG